MLVRSLLVSCLAALLAVPAHGQDILRLEAEEITRFAAEQAGQGAAADSAHVYAIVNSAIGLQGQAFAWDHSTDERGVWGISRPNSEVRAFRIPEIPRE